MTYPNALEAWQWRRDWLRMLIRHHVGDKRRERDLRRWAAELRDVAAVLAECERAG